jgi:chemotaxis signal transduction protein
MHASTAPRLRLAHARIGAVHIGIPAACVVQAVPAPQALSPLPLRDNALRGVIEHDGALVPVVDLARWVDVGSSEALAGDAARILVLREGARTIGLQVDALGGLAELEQAQIMRLHQGDDPDDVFHSAVRLADGGAILSLLEVGKLADLALAWSEAAPAASGPAAAPASQSATGTDAPDETSLYALLDTGLGVLGVPPANLAEVIPMPALERLGAGGAYCTWRGRHLAVLSCAAIMGRADDAADAGNAPALLAVFAHDGLVLGMPVQAVLQLRSFAPGLAAPDGKTSTVYADGAAIRLLDTARLFADAPEAALSREQARSTAAAQPAAGPADAGAGNDCAYIVFEADGMQAVPIGAVEHIVPMAAQAMAAATMPWQGAAIPLTDLRAPASTQAGSPGHVLVARGAQGHAGFVVARVHSLIPAGTGKVYGMGAGTRRIQFITAGEGTAQASYRIAGLDASR